MQNRVLLSTIFVMWCFALDAYAFINHSCDVSKGWVTLKSSQPDTSRAIIDLKPETIQLGQPFSFRLIIGSSKLANAGQLPPPDRVTATATMPAHKHGMNYTPTIAYTKGSDHYDIQGFVFHMPGIWEISISAYWGDNATHYTQSLTIK